MMKPVFLGDNGFVAQAATKAVNKENLSYQQYWVMSRNVCGQLVLNAFQSEAFEFTVMEKRPKRNTDPITNYEAFEGVYYHMNPMENKKHRSITMGFR
jgi:regulatory protein YycI of two-component signal transduction system YycFG